MKVCSSENEFIEYLAPIAQKVCRRYSYKPSILIGQVFQENGAACPKNFDNDGIYDLLKNCNLVGQKKDLLNDTWTDYTVWPGKWFSKQTPEEYNGKKVTITDDFRIFDSDEQSLADYILFLLYAKDSVNSKTYRYGPDVVNTEDPKELIEKVGKKYATDSSYAESIWNIVTRYNLTKYDDLTGVQPTDVVPDILKEEKETVAATTKKLESRAINDITAANKSEVPRSRGSNPIQYIVCHYLGVPNADNPYLYGGGYGGHYNIKRDGSIYKAADPKTAVVWHCGGGLQGSGGHTFYGKCTNYNSIGIECGVCYTDTSAKEGDGDSDKWYFTEATQESLVWLVSKLMDEYSIPIDRVIRHYDVTGKICPNPYVRNNGLNGNWTWDEFKVNLAQYRKDGTITIPSRSTASSTGSTSKAYLSKGDSGTAVKAVQKYLIAIGFSCGSAGADGDWGTNTQMAFESFREAYGADIAADGGKCGDVTQKFLKQLYTIIQSGIFNATYYLKKYADLKAAFGTSKAKSFAHFWYYGMKEGRQASKTFKVQAYQKRYEDLRKAFGDDLKSYYLHYVQYGKKEGRKAT